ncbi:GNAT family N-acetyltransferase [Orrella marina]|uniref:GNAT family N-acetyltransferase n=1 Tax=Orrella marina TaxID=2163011 RepID=A0A2R4XL29_9BURK|nr:GNAT family N-acetyltransferase [Orrella marina]AWB34510.1 GNAT family N-acetyltransferase [Orrella marina]
MLNITDAQITRDLKPIHALLNEVIETSTALYDYQPRPLAQVSQWMADKLALGLPVRVALDEQERFLGFATFGPFRPHPAYKYTVEHSIYVDSAARGQGIGSAMLEDIVQCAIDRNLHLIVGAIDADNTASIALHRRHGFIQAGVIEQAGFKFGRWLDLALLHKRLPTPEDPQDG